MEDRAALSRRLLGSSKKLLAGWWHMSLFQRPARLPKDGAKFAVRKGLEINLFLTHKPCLLYFPLQA
jgi:hypothetical protein